MIPLNTILRDLQLRRAILEGRVLAGHLRQLDAIFRQARGELRAAILAGDAARVADLKRRDLSALLGSARAVYGDWRTAVVPVIEAAASEAAVMGLEWWNAVLSNQLPSSFAPLLEFTSVNPAFIEAAASWPVAPGAEAAKAWGARNAADFSRVLSLQAAQAAGFGESVGQLARRLTSVFANIGRERARTVARGAFIHAGGVVADRWAQQNAALIRAQQWVATLDSDTCPRCGALDGKTWTLEEGHPPVPLHGRCRCAIVPVLKSWRELGIDADEIEPGLRASMNGEVPETVKFSDWLQDQPLEVQQEVLGKAKAAKWAADGFPHLGAYTEDGRRVLTMDELLGG